jgi:hypothetical protein
MVDWCEYGNEQLGLKHRELFDQLSNYEISKKDPEQWN